jgi:retron-type reverse transcriptase
MKRAGNLVERIADADNLRLAFWKASRGKRAKPEVLRFRADLDARLRCLRDELLSGCVRWGPYRTFMVFDPKERTICAAPFRDRVAQHAIMNVVEPHFEVYQIHDSYACRRGKGLDGAIARAVRFCRTGDWYLKMDVRKYFDSIDHATLKGLLCRRFKDPLLLALLDGVIDSHEDSPGRGVPIGNLTSQFFANHYLGVLDHHCKQALGCQRYLRYMDDFVVWDSQKDRLRQVGHEIAGFLGDSLKLDLKPVCLNACSRGMTFLGYRVYPGHVRLAARSRKRFRRKMAQYDGNYTTGRWTEEETARHVEPLLAFVRRAESQSFRRRVLESIEGSCPKEARTA